MAPPQDETEETAEAEETVGADAMVEARERVEAGEAPMEAEEMEAGDDEVT